MKTYRPAREVQADIDAVLSRRPNTSAQPLDEVAEILSAGRHYGWVGIYLVAGPRSDSRQPVATPVAPSPRARTVLPIRLGQHQFGVIEVEAESGKALAAADRVLLKGVATTLARFLHGPGAYLVRKAREAAAAAPSQQQARHQPASERVEEKTRAAAGEGRR